MQKRPDIRANVKSSTESENAEIDLAVQLSLCEYCQHGSVIGDELACDKGKELSNGCKSYELAEYYQKQLDALELKEAKDE